MDGNYSWPRDGFNSKEPLIGFRSPTLGCLTCPAFHVQAAASSIVLVLVVVLVLDLFASEQTQPGCLASFTVFSLCKSPLTSNDQRPRTSTTTTYLKRKRRG